MRGKWVWAKFDALREVWLTAVVGGKSCVRGGLGCENGGRVCRFSSRVSPVLHSYKYRDEVPVLIWTSDSSPEASCAGQWPWLVVRSL